MICPILRKNQATFDVICPIIKTRAPSSDVFHTKKKPDD
uniref:Uncharacterized protein n=1 Tax=Arundo donax TaxID=35708 RepID=A0A0A9AMS6_ARUDO